MKQRSKGVDTATPLDEDEQRAIVENVRVESERLSRVSRRLFAAIHCVALLVVTWLLASLATARPRGPGEGAGQHAYVRAAGAAPRLAAAYACTMAELACAALICLERGRRRWTRGLGLVAACGPPLLCGRTFLDAPVATWWVPLAAPLSLALALYVDADMTKLAGEVNDLDALRYKYKGV